MHRFNWEEAYKIKWSLFLIWTQRVIQPPCLMKWLKNLSLNLLVIKVRYQKKLNDELRLKRRYQRVLLQNLLISQIWIMVFKEGQIDVDRIVTKNKDTPCIKDSNKKWRWCSFSSWFLKKSNDYFVKDIQRL